MSGAPFVPFITASAGAGAGSSAETFPVPSSCVGAVIGRGGENIKRIQQESGASIRFDPIEQNTSMHERYAIISGPPETILRAKQLIGQVINRPPSAPGPGPASAPGPGPAPASGVVSQHVPVQADKAGLVIGKGGDNIKIIQQESGAHVELSRESTQNEVVKHFLVRGSPQAVHYAKHLIRIKVGDLPPGTPLPPFGSFGSFGADPFAAQMHMAGVQQQLYGGGFGGGGFGGGFGDGGFGGGAPSMGRGGADWLPDGPMMNPFTQEPDYSVQWVEYYRAIGMPEQAASIEANMVKRYESLPVPPYLRYMQNAGGMGRGRQ